MTRLTVQQLANVFNHLRKLMEPPPRSGLEYGREASRHSTKRKRLSAERTVIREVSAGSSPREC